MYICSGFTQISFKDANLHDSVTQHSLWKKKETNMAMTITSNIKAILRVEIQDRPSIYHEH